MAATWLNRLSMVFRLRRLLAVFRLRRLLAVFRLRRLLAVFRLRRLAILPIRAYQWTVSPLLPVTCRFAPSCSEYAAEAVLVHGLRRGGLLALRRLLRCHPWGGHGYDPVPRRGEGAAG